MAKLDTVVNLARETLAVLRSVEYSADATHERSPAAVIGTASASLEILLLELTATSEVDALVNADLERFKKSMKALLPYAAEELLRENHQRTLERERREQLRTEDHANVD